MKKFLTSKLTVSILLLLELAFEERGHLIRGSKWVEFQSFFYWNWLSKPKVSSMSLNFLGSFNPSSIGIGFRSSSCFALLSIVQVVSILLLLELAFEERTGGAYVCADTEFQSFFYWNWLSKAYLVQL